MASPLRKNFDYYLEHQEEIVEQYNDKFVVIKGCAVIGAYDDELEAVEVTQKEHKLGTFLVQHVSSGDASYSHSFHSRVAFS